MLSTQLSLHVLFRSTQLSLHVLLFRSWPAQLKLAAQQQRVTNYQQRVCRELRARLLITLHPQQPTSRANTYRCCCLAAALTALSDAPPTGASPAPSNYLPLPHRYYYLHCCCSSLLLPSLLPLPTLLLHPH